jgi:hypothetical protein
MPLCVSIPVRKTSNYAKEAIIKWVKKNDEEEEVGKGR